MRCAHCEGDFQPKDSRGRFCAAKCRKAAWQETRRARLVRLEERLSIALAEVQALRRAYVRR